MADLLRDLERHQDQMSSLLERFVQMESPSGDKARIDALAAVLADEWRKRGAEVTEIASHSGNHLLVRFSPANRAATGQIMLLGHLDTVYPAGTLETMPFRLASGRAYGPGVFDMKGGLVIALAAFDALRRAGVEPRRPITCLWNSDEETGSFSSRELIERECRASQAVLVLEPAAEPKGAIKTARKGVGEIEMKVTGRAAHSGLRPQDGVNAVLELALQIARVSKWNNPRRGIGVQANVAAGGTRVNVIAAEASCQIDLRAERQSDIRALERKFRALRPITRGARLEVKGGFNRPPMERRMAAALFAKAKLLASEIRWKLQEATVGGGSDGNLTASLGIPTLDGLGAVGEGAHSLEESIVIKELPRRAALLAGLIASL
ncbi:MAG TPA: M20 family metallopeptidase [Candidatus Acidoferrales bacterium]|nr:M20 family metallopeptidase [Candidatus Acidoferrales bacterium]